MLLYASTTLRSATDLCRQTPNGGGVFQLGFAVVSSSWGGSGSTE